jgi:hypothetical protein
LSNATENMVEWEGERNILKTNAIGLGKWFSVVMWDSGEGGGCPGFELCYWTVMPLEVQVGKGP